MKAGRPIFSVLRTQFEWLVRVGVCTLPLFLSQPADASETRDPVSAEALLATLNSDTDSLSNEQEQLHGTDPLLWDTDGDQVSDDKEIQLGLDPGDASDSDADGLPDDWQSWIRREFDGQSSNPANDPDEDGVINRREFELGTSPVNRRRHIVIFLAEDHGNHWSGVNTPGLNTPSLERLAENGVHFSHAFAASPVCSPSKMSLYTGVYPHQHSGVRNVPNYGVTFPLDEARDNSNLGRGGIHEDLPTLIEILSDRGWHTAVTLKTHVQPIRKFPFHQGFSGADVATPPAVSETVRKTFRAAGQRPVLLILNVAGPHLPFRALPRANGTWNEQGGLIGDGGVTDVDPESIEVPQTYPDTAAVRQDFADYYGSIQVVDSLLNAARQTLQDMGLSDSTLFIYTSDHGMGLHRAKQSIFASGLAVPLIIAGTDVFRGVDLKAPVTHLDLAPTILEFAGIAPMRHLVGESLWPLLKGKSHALDERRTVLLTANDKYDARAVTDGEFYYIRNLRQPAGGILRAPEFVPDARSDPWLSPALNDDQYASAHPWFNRTFSATVNQEPSLPRTLLRELVEGTMPDEALYNLRTDPWMVENLIDDSGHHASVDMLREELEQWRDVTGDSVDDSRTLKRRTQRIPIAAELGSARECPDVPQVGWTTLLCDYDNRGFRAEGNWIAPPTTRESLAISNRPVEGNTDSWQASVETQFLGPGVIASLVFAFEDLLNYYRLDLQDLRGASVGHWNARLIEIRSGTEFVHWRSDAVAADNAFRIRDGDVYTLKVEFNEAENQLKFGIENITHSVQVPLAGTVTVDSLRNGRFGVYARSSSVSRFRNLNHAPSTEQQTAVTRPGID